MEHGYILMAGSIGYTATFFLLARCLHYWQFMLCLGVLGGSSSAAIVTVSQGVISHWFKKRRGQASGFAMVGSALGGITFPLMLKSLLEKLGWAWAMRTVGFVIIACLTVGNMFCRGRLLATSTSAVVDIRCFLDSKFNWLTVSVFSKTPSFLRLILFCCLIQHCRRGLTVAITKFELLLMSGLGLIPTYAADANYGQAAGFYLITAMNM
jgi:MFS family permease